MQMNDLIFSLVVTCKCAAFFDQFFSWSFWSSSTLPRLVVLRCIVWHFVVCFVLHCGVLWCAVLCCDVMLCVVICLLLVSLVFGLKFLRFPGPSLDNSTQQLEGWFDQLDQLDDLISKPSTVYSPQANTVFSVEFS